MARITYRWVQYPECKRATTISKLAGIHKIAWFLDLIIPFAVCSNGFNLSDRVSIIISVSHFAFWMVYIATAERRINKILQKRELYEYSKYNNVSNVADSLPYTTCPRCGMINMKGSSRCMQCGKYLN